MVGGKAGEGGCWWSLALARVSCHDMFGPAGAPEAAAVENLDIRAKTPPHQTDVVLTVLGMKRQCLQKKGKKNKQGQQCGCHVWCLVNLTV